jgi:hypothetical protein
MLLAAGADPDLQDREGYTPLHMAAGYSQTASMMALLEADADPLLRDGKGQDVPLLIDGLRAKMPPVAQLLQRRMALEQVRLARALSWQAAAAAASPRRGLLPPTPSPPQPQAPNPPTPTAPALNASPQVAAVLTRRLYDEVDVAGILEERPGAEAGEREFLVQFKVRGAGGGVGRGGGRVGGGERAAHACSGPEPAGPLRPARRPRPPPACRRRARPQDGAPDAWVPERDVAPDVVEDWDAGVERAEVAGVADMVQWGTERQFLVQWADGKKVRGRAAAGAGRVTAGVA